MEIQWQSRPEKKLLAKLLPDKKTAASLLILGVNIEVNSSEDAVEKTIKQKQKMNLEDEEQFKNP